MEAEWNHFNQSIVLCRAYNGRTKVPKWLEVVPYDHTMHPFHDFSTIAIVLYRLQNVRSRSGRAQIFV